MEDYIKRQIDLLGQMLLLLAKKLGLFSGDITPYTLQSVQEELQSSGVQMDINAILAKEHPVSYLVDTLQFSIEALETFVQIVLNSDAEADIKDALLQDAVSYLDSIGHFSISLHSYQNC